MEVVTPDAVSGLEGEDGMLEAVRWRHGTSEEEVRRPIRHLFLFIGAEPNTDLAIRIRRGVGREGVRVDRRRRRRAAR